SKASPDAPVPSALPAVVSPLADDEGTPIVSPGNGPVSGIVDGAPNHSPGNCSGARGVDDGTPRDSPGKCSLGVENSPCELPELLKSDLSHASALPPVSLSA